MLHRLFHGKCAYCECKYEDTQPMDVEHFRPKGAIKEDGEKLAHPGYYWLAADWDNLLPSCIDCNRQRTQESGLTNRRDLLGKGNEFPLAANSKRVLRHNEVVDNEVYLLLNPCNLIINPEDHLDFLEDGLVIPKRIDGIKPSKFGQASIKIFGLNRVGLVNARKEKSIQIQHIKFNIRGLLQQLQADGEKRNDFSLDIFHEQMNLLAKMCSPKESFTALARQRIIPFIDSFQN